MPTLPMHKRATSLHDYRYTLDRIDRAVLPQPTAPYAAYEQRAITQAAQAGHIVYADNGDYRLTLQGRAILHNLTRILYPSA